MQRPRETSPLPDNESMRSGDPDYQPDFEIEDDMDSSLIGGRNYEKMKANANVNVNVNVNANANANANVNNVNNINNTKHARNKSGKQVHFKDDSTSNTIDTNDTSEINRTFIPKIKEESEDEEILSNHRPSPKKGSELRNDKGNMGDDMDLLMAHMHSANNSDNDNSDNDNNNNNDKNQQNSKDDIMDDDAMLQMFQAVETKKRDSFIEASNKYEAGILTNATHLLRQDNDTHKSFVFNFLFFPFVKMDLLQRGAMWLIFNSKKKQLFFVKTHRGQKTFFFLCNVRNCANGLQCKRFKES